MILSMTGYGRASADSKKFVVDVEIKSINSRYLELFLKLPQQLQNKEYELREIIKNRIKRGKLSVIILLKKNGLAEDEISLDTDKLKNYISLLKQVKKAAKISEKIKLEHILYSRDIFTSTIEEISEEEFKVVASALDSAIDNLMEMKKKEGRELEKDLKKRIKFIEKKLDEIESLSQDSVNEHFSRYQEKVKQLLEEKAQSIPDDRMMMELAILAERADITEECVRLRSHLKFFLEAVEKEQEPGRKLNFLCQEMNRETNTISSKTLSVNITHNTVFIKEEIERIREQIQNIE
ncbi:MULTISPECIES: YicC/YloC family endoribonuclease [Ignavibacterium]|uniref:YicC/YloC family endoribonuclease n=1 Tax=Ignavibacterium TaxID=795750 RepID=UPI0025C1007A|nr:MULTISPECIES: YicC/YloC family endoribonuclease [Ignavibacterium]MBI5660522.1 YicC family protein [Ignavibacterium album]